MLMLVSAAVHAQAFVLRKQFPKNNAFSLRQFWNRYMQDGSVCTGCRLLFYSCGWFNTRRSSPALCVGVYSLQKVLRVKDYFHKLASGYKTFFFRACTFILLFGACLLFSFCIVYPLWLLATRYTQVYTAVTLLLFSALVSVFIIKRNIKNYKTHPRKFFYSLIKKLILLGGFILFFVFIFTYHRVSAILILILSFVLYGFVAFGFSEDRM